MKGPYYVYEHWLDNQCFYVGKGSYIYNRATAMRDSVRNEKWKNFVGNRKHDVVVKIIKEFEFESDAYDYEEALSKIRLTEGHPLQCERLGNKFTKELREKFIGENNPMFGKNAYENKTDEEMEAIANSKREKLVGFRSGSDNPFYNKKHTEEFKKWQSEKTTGGNNPKAKKVKVTLNNEERCYSCIKDAAKDYTSVVYKLVKTGEEYKTPYKNKKYLEGMRVQYI